MVKSTLLSGGSPSLTFRMSRAPGRRHDEHPMNPVTAVARVGIPAHLWGLEGGDPRVALADGLLQAIVALTGADGVAVEVIGPGDADLDRFDASSTRRRRRRPGAARRRPGRAHLRREPRAGCLRPPRTRACPRRRGARARGLPRLQVVIVALGGTLHEDLVATEVAHRIAAGNGAGRMASSPGARERSRLATRLPTPTAPTGPWSSPPTTRACATRRGARGRCERRRRARGSRAH